MSATKDENENVAAHVESNFEIEIEEAAKNGKFEENHRTPELLLREVCDSVNITRIIKPE